MIYYINAYWLNIRREPNSKRSNIITSIPHGHEVRALRKQGNWWLIGTYYQDNYLEGYAYSEFLNKGHYKIADLSLPDIPEVYLIHRDTNVDTQSTSWAHSINDPHRPGREMTSLLTRTSGIHKILDYLNVESSKRYKSIGDKTFCNIYAHDYATLCGAYLPRVWWNDGALIALATGQTVDVRYSVTVNEMNANRLYDWLYQWGPQFGWSRVFNLDDVQNAANAGKVCLLSAKRKQSNASGHICLVVPESPEHEAIRMEGKVQTPVMSQAGTTNQKYYARRWWTHNKFNFFGFWIFR